MGVQPPVWQGNPTGRACPSSLALGRFARPGLVEVQRADQAIERGQGVDQRKSATNVGPGRESLEIPGDVLADVATCPYLAAVVLGEVLGVSTQRLGHLPQGGLDPRRGPRESRSEVGEPPWPAQAAATHDDSVTPGLLDHRERVFLSL